VTGSGGRLLLAGQPAAPRQSVGQSLAQMLELRTRAVAAAGVLYVLGYLPGLQVQYFVAGVVPGAIIVAVYAVVREVDRIVGFMTTRVTDPTAHARAPWGRVLLGVLLVSLVVMVVGGTTWFRALVGGPAPLVVGAAEFVIVAFSLVSGIVLALSVAVARPGMRTRSSGWSRWARRLSVVWGYLVLVPLPLLAFLLYALYLYPNLPQELGGVRPRCARMDIETQKVSREVQQALLEFAGGAPAPVVLQSRPLDVLFSGGDFWLVQPAHAPSGAEGAPPPVYEIRKGAVSAVLWCGQGNSLHS
jgi:hypothetical protein